MFKRTYEFEGQKLDRRDFIKEVIKLYVKKNIRIEKLNSTIKLKNHRYLNYSNLEADRLYLLIEHNYRYIVAKPKKYYNLLKAKLADEAYKDRLRVRYEDLTFEHYRDELLLRLVRNGRTSSEAFKKALKTSSIKEVEELEKEFTAAKVFGLENSYGAKAGGQ